MSVRFAPTTALERHVARWIRTQAKGYGRNGVKGAVKDLFHGGCASGMVGHLIYTADCVRFHKRHRAEIRTMLYQALSDHGLTAPGDLLRDWDASDPLADESGNQTVLAHFAFEETARRLCDAAGLEY